jgi:hypothetical protein
MTKKYFSDEVYSKTLDSSEGSASDLLIKTGTGKTIVLDKSVYSDAPMAFFWRGTSTEASVDTFVGGIKQFKFDIGKVIYINNVEAPHDYKYGTGAEIHLHWMIKKNLIEGDKVKWQFEFAMGNTRNGTNSMTILCDPANPTVFGTKTVDVELSLSDYHLAKRHIDGDNSPYERCKRYFTTATTLIYNVKSLYDIDTIVFPISNDFFHTDNYQHQTTAGTPQDTIVDYAHEYELGFELLVDTITMMKKLCNNIQVVLVQGNHDRTKSYYLAHALDVYFKADPNIYFDREHSTVKATLLGETFIGYHHGNCKIEDLPLLFATHPEYSQLFGYAKYREVHTGDKHHYMAKEVKGVRIQQMPSLSGTDRWHQDNNFVHSVRAALALVYDKELGKICEFEERI